MADAVLVRVTSEMVVGDSRATALWLVVADDPDHAVRIVKERVPAHCIVEATDHHVTRATVEKLGLARGQAWHI
jgi:hypothetical protein